MQSALAQSLIRRTPEAVSCELGGESVILDMASGVYFALDSIGTTIWDLLQTPCDMDNLCQALMQEYNVDAARCREDVLVLLQDLAGHGLIKLDDER
jgi:Coenzyme PQQ synthesis protein D (PqqD)